MKAIAKIESTAPIRSVTIIAWCWLAVKEDPIVSGLADFSFRSGCTLDSSDNIFLALALPSQVGV